MSFFLATQYHFDISGEHPDNLVVKEPIEIDPDSGTTIVVPNYAPFYAKGFKLYLPNGVLLTKGVDYQFINPLEELTAYTAKSVVGIVEILRPNTPKVLATYQTLGDTLFWDSSLVRLIVNAVEDDRPVYWENLHDKPLGFPSDIHGHSLIYQLTSFSDFVKFINEFHNTVSEDRRLIELKLANILPLMEAKIARYESLLNELIASHSQGYNNHGLTKTQIGLPLVDNFKTATVQEAKLGASNQMHLTPPGLAAVINDFGYDQSRLLEADSLPMSMYGNRNFLPPEIDGSYESLGCSVNRGGACIEEDGSLSILTPRTDGRFSGLYFGKVTNFMDQATIKYEYTNVLYTNEMIENSIGVATTIMGGSNHEVIVVGNDSKDGMFIARSNGTFNPARHDYKRIDTSSAALPRVNGVLTYSNVVFLGDRIGIMMHASRSVPGNSESYGTVKMFYIDVLDLTDTTADTVVLHDWLINYTMPDGKVVTNSQYLDLSPMAIDPNDPSKMKQLYYTFPESLKNASGGGYRSVNVTATLEPDDGRRSVINVARSFYFTYRDSNGVLRAPGMFPNEVIWIRDGDNFTLSDHTPITDMSVGNLGYSYTGAIGARVSNFSDQCSSMLSNGQRVTFMQGGGGTTGAITSLLIEKCDKSAWEWLQKCSFTQNHNVSTISVRETFSPPTKRGIMPTEITWLRDGYEVTHLNSEASGVVKTRVKLHDSNATSNLPFYPWSTDDDIVLNSQLVAALPIPNVTQEERSALVFSRPDTNLTGDTAFLASVSAGYGVNLKHNYGLNRNVGGMGVFPPPLNVLTDDGVLLYDSAGDLLYYPSTVVNQLKALVEAEGVHPVKAVNICDFTANINKNTPYAGSWKPNIAFAMVTYGKFTPAAPSKFVRLFIIRPIIQNNTEGLYNSNYPRIVTGFTLLDSSGERQLTSSESGMSATTWGISSSAGATATNRRMFQAYVSNNKLTFAFESATYSGTTGSSTTTAMAGILDLGSNTLDSYSAYGLDPAWNTNSRLPVPRVGMATSVIYPLSYGGCAIVANLGGPNLYCLYSTLLKDKWFLYITKKEVVFNGRVYPFENKVIDVRNADPGYLNTYFYLYVKLENGAPVFYLSKNKYPDTVFHLWIGGVATGGVSAGILKIDRKNVLTLNGIRIGNNRGGSTIMGSVGSVNESGSIPWFSRDDVV